MEDNFDERLDILTDELIAEVKGNATLPELFDYDRPATLIHATHDLGKLLLRTKNLYDNIKVVSEGLGHYATKKFEDYDFAAEMGAAEQGDL